MGGEGTKWNIKKIKSPAKTTAGPAITKSFLYSPINIKILFI
jgi:hypothetical protein